MKPTGSLNGHKEHSTGSLTIWGRLLRLAGPQREPVDDEDPYSPLGTTRHDPGETQPEWMPNSRRGSAGGLRPPGKPGGYRLTMPSLMCLFTWIADGRAWALRAGRWEWRGD